MEKTLFVVPVWLIEGYPDYFFAEDKNLYRIKENGKARQCRQTMIGYSKGYVLKSKFHTLTRLRGMLKKNQDTNFATVFESIKLKNI